MMETYPCPFCGAQAYVDREKKVVGHQRPECESWKLEMLVVDAEIVSPPKSEDA